MPAPTIAPAVAAALIGAAGSTVAGIGSGMFEKKKADQETAMQKEALRGPIRGGSERAGNAGDFKVDDEVMAKLGQTAIPTKTPVYGSMDLEALFKPQSFGKGFSVGNRYNV